MARNLNPKLKLSRRDGIKLFAKSEKKLAKRNYPPGMHGQSGKTRMTLYGKQLREKQKAKRLYHLLERQFRNYYEKAIKMSGNNIENLIRLLETRLDNVVYRLGFVISREVARQMVTHGHFLVNGKKVAIPSYQVRVGEVITINPVSQKNKYWLERVAQLKKVETLGWLAFDTNSLSGKVVAIPTKDEVPVPFDPTLILEFYSR